MRYAKIAPWIAGIRGAEKIGTVGPRSVQYPFYRVRRGIGKKVLFLAGVHGDEPAGVETLIDFFETESRHYESEIEFTAFPCVNPWGFDNFERENGFGLNINREFKTCSPSEEVQLIQRHLEKYEVAIDLHEVMKEWKPVGRDEPVGEDPEEFFLWENCRDHSRRIGSQIVMRVQMAGHSVCKWPTIYDDINSGGVIWYPEGARSACYGQCDSSDAFLVKHGYTQQAFTIETPRKEQLFDRIEMNTIALKTILDNVLKR